MYNIKEEIKLITNVQDFLTVHEAKGHCLTEHLLDHTELKNKLYKMSKPKYEDDIVMATTFFSQEQALSAIQKALEENKERIENWRKKLLDPYCEIQIELEEAVGEGIAKNCSFNDVIKVHGLRVILIQGDTMGRAFYIKTAYPCPVFSDVDEVYDAMDRWAESRRK